MQVDEERIRREIADILSQPKYQGGSGSQVAWWRRFIYWLLDLIMRASDLVGGPVVAGIIALLLVVALATVITLHLGKRRTREVEARLAIERTLARGDDPADLERMAETAATRGDYASAVRLLFVAGLLRLDDRGRIMFSPGTPTTEYIIALGSAELEELAGQFDRIVYGRRQADGEDYAGARYRWRELLQQIPA